MPGNLDNVSTVQQRIATLAQRSPEFAFTSLAHDMTLDWLEEAYHRTRKDGAAGVDDVTGKEYEEILDELKPYSQMPKYRELIRKLLYYVAYNVEMPEAGVARMENKTRETTGDNTMPSVTQVYIEKGEAKSKVEAIFDLLEDRFEEVPQATKVAVAKVTDLAVLRRLTLLAANCKSLAEFKKALK